MRLSAFAGFFVVAMIFLATNNSQFNAQALDIKNIDNKSIALAIRPESNKEPNNPDDKQKENPIYIVISGDNLTKIAEQYQTTWKRIYDKNTDLKHPDVISVGDKITIPLPEEKLAERQLPDTISLELSATVNQPVTQPNTQKPSVYRGTSSGNTYSPGYCTWYAKTRRPDMPNNLGNANTWVSRAAAQGLATGSVPRVGAIGQQGMHVVYVESVNADGTVTISEMNYNGWNVVSSRTVPASIFLYIY